MSWCEKIKTLKDIPVKEYDGYYWDSDSQAPVRVRAGSLPDQFLTGGTNPTNHFILEAHFYCKEDNTSVSIRHVPGSYLIHKYNLSMLDPSALTKREMLAHKALDGKLIFKEVWLPVADEQCAGLEVLTRQALVFCGFDQEGK